MKAVALAGVIASMAVPGALAALPARKCGGSGTSTATCRDRGPAGNAWYDSDGVEYNCVWYRDNAQCPGAEQFPNFGLDANEACCGCGGGEAVGTVNDSTGSTGSGTGGISDTGSVVPPPTAEVNDVCTDKTGPNGVDWHGDGGTQYDCTYYAQGDRCQRNGDRFRNFGFTANEACCVCNGGDTAPDTGTVARREVGAGDLPIPPTAPSGVWELQKGANEQAHNTDWISGGSAADLVLRRDQRVAIPGPRAEFTLQAQRSGYSEAFPVENTFSGINTLTIPVEMPIGRYYLLADGQSLGTVVILFNPWSQNDIVYMADEQERDEYIKSPTTKYFFGNVYGYPRSLSVGASTWQLNTAQVLDDVLDLLEYTVGDWEECGNDRLIMDFADPIKVIA